MHSTLVVSDLDGTLSTVEVWRGVLEWVTRNRSSRAARWFVRARLPAVALAKAGAIPMEPFKARWFRDIAALLAGMPAEQVGDLADWVASEWLWPARRTAAIDAVGHALRDARTNDASSRLVLATGAYQEVADAFGRLLGADVVLGTPFEVAGGRLTGRLAGPVQTGAQKAAAVRSLAAGGTVVVAFGDTGADIPLLRLARRAVAVAPDRELRREAQAAGWEVVDGR